MPVAGCFIHPQGTGAALGFEVGWTHDTMQWNFAGTRMVMMLPEPETYAQMLTALALMAPLLRRRRVS